MLERPISASTDLGEPNRRAGGPTAGIRARLVSALREPVVQFLLIGGAIFLLHGLTTKPSADEQLDFRIDRATLARFAESRPGTFEAGPAAGLTTMRPGEVSALVEALTREELSYREAKALGLDQQDYLIRRRLSQSLDFLFRNVAPPARPSRAELEAFYRQNLAHYVAPGDITFSHIFFDAERRGWKNAEKEAQQLLPRLNGPRGEAIMDAGWPGDRFAYEMNYAARTRPLIESQFGTEMTARLFASGADSARWQGPFRSTSGYHLARIVDIAPSRQARFEEVAGEVARDYRLAREDRMAATGLQALKEKYRVTISPEVQRLMEKRR